MRKSWWGRLVKAGALGVLAIAVTIVASTIWVHAKAGDHLYDEADVPAAPVAIVLGAQVYASGEPSAFLAARLEVARRLLVAGKVKVILVSGDNMQWEYDEPSAMRDWLIEQGVPDRKIVRDYAGFDTYDSCARAKQIFGVDQAIVVTQSYHLPRAVALCRQLGIDAVGVGDDTARQFRDPWVRGSVREFGACVKAVFDVVSGREPVHLGRHETGVEDALRDS